jgi:protein-tyrosine phosphatase
MIDTSKIAPLVPIINFAKVRGGLYRGAQPQYRWQYEWIIKNCKVQNFVTLRRKDDDSRYAIPDGCRVLDIQVEDDHAPTFEQADAFLSFIALHAHEGVFFHCEHGHGRTSLFAVLVRLSEGWTLDDALAEQKALGYEFTHPAQLQFLRDYVRDSGAEGAENAA